MSLNFPDGLNKSPADSLPKSQNQVDEQNPLLLKGVEQTPEVAEADRVIKNIAQPIIKDNFWQLAKEWFRSVRNANVEKLFQPLFDLFSPLNADERKLLKSINHIQSSVLEALQKGDFKKENQLIENLEDLSSQEEFKILLEDNDELFSEYETIKMNCLEHLSHSFINFLGNPSPEEFEGTILKYMKDVKNPDEKETMIATMRHLAFYSQTPIALQKVLMRLPQHLANLDGPSLAERNAHRAPTEVLVHLLSYLDNNKNKWGDLPEFKTVEEKTKHQFLQHRMLLKETHEFLDWVIKEISENQDLDKLSQLCKTLKSQLPDKDKALADTRLHDNIYGRVFDSALVDDLVKNPPLGVQTAMTTSANNFGQYLERIRAAKNLNPDRHQGDRFCELFAKKLQHMLKKESRFWLPQAPELIAIRDARSPKEVYSALIHYLESPKKTGVECISASYILIRLSIGLSHDIMTADITREEKIAQMQQICPWMINCNINYGKVMQETSRISRTSKNHIEDPYLTAGGGITLPHQPSVIREDWMIPSERAATINRPDLSYPSTSLVYALDFGHAWGSGVSGSTNIVLHALHHFQNLPSFYASVDNKDVLLGTMMYLTYDGGHSLHETLWTANQLDRQLKLGFNLSQPNSSPNKFVSNFENLEKFFGGNESGEAFKRATEIAINKTVEYFNEHSFFSEKEEVP